MSAGWNAPRAYQPEHALSKPLGPARGVLIGVTIMLGIWGLCLAVVLLIIRP